MIRALLRLVLLTLPAISVIAQSTDSTPKFIATDARQSPLQSRRAFSTPVTGGNVFEMRFATMVDLIRITYGVDKDKVIGGPNWLELGRYHVRGLAPAGTSLETKKLMMRSLLADRFHAVLEPGIKPMLGSALTVGKQHKLKQADPAGQTGCSNTLRRLFDAPDSPSPSSSEMRVTCRNITMAAFTDTVKNLLTRVQPLSPKPVIDKTNLAGAWDFDIQVPVTSALEDDIHAYAYLSQVFEKQLGIKLEPEMVPVPVVEVKSVDRVPTPNAAGLERYFPPPPTEFEVASVKPVQPNGIPSRAGMQIRNGRVYLPNIPLSVLITLAWDLDDADDIAGAPSWLSSERFDIEAKAPVDLPEVLSPVDLEPIRPMLQNLLIERFKLKAHVEERPTLAYTLKAVKPKLAKAADPNARMKWHDGPPYGNTDLKAASTALGRLVTCENMDLDTFARLLPQFSASDIRHPVVNATGLQGNYTFSFNYVAAAVLGRVRSADGSVTDPSGRLTIFDAMEKQLGLKLERQDRPFPFLVIENIERTPTEN